MSNSTFAALLVRNGNCSTRWCVLLAIAVAVQSSRVNAQTCEGRWLPGQGLPGLNGEVMSLLEWRAAPGAAGPQLVAGGKFTIAGTAVVSNIASWDGQTWRSLGGGVDGTVYALAESREGNLVVGGAFANAGAVPAKYVAQWNGIQWTPMGAGFTGDFFTGVRSLLVMEDGSIVAGGDFVTSGATTVNGIARWTGGSWIPFGVGFSKTGSPPAKVSALARLRNGELIAGGTFQTADGLPIGGIARWDGVSWKSLGAGLAQFGYFPRVNALRVTVNGDLVVGGYFDSAGGATAKYIARWNGSAWLPFPKNPGEEILVLAIMPNGDIVAGGSLGTYHGIARWNGSSWTAMSGGVNPAFTGGGYLNALCVKDDGQLVAGGSFQYAGSSASLNVATWSTSGWASLGTGLNSRANAIVGTPDGGMVIGGVFTAAGGLACNNVARWNGVAWDAMAGGVVQAGQIAPVVERLATRSNGDVVAAGQFDKASGQWVTNIASWDGQRWKPFGPGLSSYYGGVRWLANAPNGDLIASGSLELPGGTVRIAKWNGSAWASLGGNATFGGPIASLGDGSLVACDSLAGLAKWNGNLWTKIPGALDQGIMSMCALAGGEIVIGGNFSFVNGRGMPGIAVWNGAWQSMGAGIGGTVTDLKSLSNGDLIAAGVMTGVGRRHGSTWTALGTGFNGSVKAIDVLASGEIVAAGDFTLAGGKVSAYWARWSDNPKPWVAISPESCTHFAGETFEIASSPANGFENVFFQWRRNGLNVQNGPEGASVGGGTVAGASGSFGSPTDRAEARLVITGIQHADAGTYDVLFWNACGDALSKPADIRIKLNQSDLNADGLVDDADFGMFVQQYDLMLCDDPGMVDGCSADVDNNGVVDDQDFVLFVPHYNRMIE